MDANDLSDTITVIPARMASKRLPGKPLADLCGKPMIVRVWECAMAAATGPVLVAAAESEIVTVIERAGGEAIVTDPDLPSGSDRIARALELRDPHRRYRFVINLQGDLPLIDPLAITRCLEPFINKGVEISTLVAEITDREEIVDPNVVKAIAEFPVQGAVAPARDFVRHLPADAKPPFWHHIGIYAYRRKSLERFVTLPVSAHESERKLEQMRALDNGMDIVVARVDTVPLGVDTPGDLERARQLFRQHAEANDQG